VSKKPHFGHFKETLVAALREGNLAKFPGTMSPKKKKKAA